jgi:hypothetical protein
MFHIELRQFPHNMCHFNMTERELMDTIVDGWAREQWIEMGERKWNPHQSKLTVIEGPEIPVQQLSMGRGWPSAQRNGEDVTERMIAQAKRAIGVEGAAPAGERTQIAGIAPDRVAMEQLQTLLGEDPAALLQAWRLASERRRELTPSEALALAEQTLSSLDAGKR